jgi:hypothetical protein
VEAKDEPVDIVILTNGPGEVATWVKPVVATLRQSSKEQGIDMRFGEHSTNLHPLQCERFFGHCRFCFAESLNFRMGFTSQTSEGQIIMLTY